MDMNNLSPHKEENKENKLCRACSDFKSWVNNKRASMFSSFVSENMTNNQEQINQHASRDDCPLDKDNLGHRTWSFLHTMAAYFPDEPSTQQQKEMTLFMKLFSKYYPCDHCAKDFRKEITEVPPDTSSRQAFSLWLCKMHNIVNKKLGKEEFDCTLVDERWRDGWKSGVCDE